jgi:hypothetical protein
MEADVPWKAAMRPRLPTGLGKRFAFPTSPTALLATREKESEEDDQGRGWTDHLPPAPR